MDDHNGTRSLRDGCLDELIINLKRMDIWLHQYWFQTTVGDSEDRSNIGISRYDNLVTRSHLSHLNIGPEDEPQGIKPVTASDGIAGSDIVGIMLLERMGGFPPEIPTAIQHTIHGLAVFGIMEMIYIV